VEPETGRELLVGGELRSHPFREPAGEPRDAIRVCGRLAEPPAPIVVKLERTGKRLRNGRGGRRRLLTFARVCPVRDVVVFVYRSHREGFAQRGRDTSAGLARQGTIVQDRRLPRPSIGAFRTFGKTRVSDSSRVHPF
jgi:hypothetical protein